MLEIVLYPDALLRQVSSPIENFDAPLHELLDAMYDLMVKKNGVGISAIQVGRPIRAFLACIPDEEGNWHKKDLLEIINPTILDKQGKIAFNEGCLSIPDFYEKINRYQSITLSYQDRFGNHQEITAKDYQAVVFQHEIDHLDGILFIDKLSILKRKKFEKDFKKSKNTQ